jgi:hypothetical protein
VCRGGFELYNLREDPYEANNIFAEAPRVRAGMPPHAPVAMLGPMLGMLAPWGTFKSLRKSLELHCYKVQGSHVAAAASPPLLQPLFVAPARRS